LELSLVTQGVLAKGGGGSVSMIRLRGFLKPEDTQQAPIRSMIMASGPVPPVHRSKGGGYVVAGAGADFRFALPRGAAVWLQEKLAKYRAEGRGRAAAWPRRFGREEAGAYSSHTHFHTLTAPFSIHVHTQPLPHGSIMYIAYV